MKTSLIRDDLVYPELSYKLIGYAFEVFDELGPGHSEKTYQKAYALMLRKNNHPFIEQAYYPIKFRNEIISKGFLDFKVEDKIIIELKKDGRFSKTRIEQVFNYLKISQLKLALLINFATEGVLFKRIINIVQDSDLSSKSK